MRAHILILLSLFCMGVSALAQGAVLQPWTDTLTMQSIERHDGTLLRGRIVSMSSRELSVVLADGTRLVLPKHLVRTISSLEGEPSAGAISGVNTATYVLTSSALPMPKGSSSLQFNIAGISLEAFPSERVSVGLLASWFSAPIAATAMYRLPLSEDIWLGAGGFVGWGGSLADRNFLAAPTLTLTFQSGVSNVSLTAGYGATSLAVETYPRPEFSEMSQTQVTTSRGYLAFGISTRLSRKVRLIVDAFMITGSGSVLLPDGRWMRTEDYDYYDPSVAFTRNFETFSNIFIIPAIRWEYSATSYWQFGFAGYKGNLLNIQDNSNWAPLPIPVVQWVIAL